MSKDKVNNNEEEILEIINEISKAINKYSYVNNEIEQIEKIKTARVTMPEVGDIGIPSNIIKQNRDKVIELIEYYLKLEDTELS